MYRQQNRYGGIRDVRVSHAEIDSARGYARAYLVLGYGDSINDAPLLSMTGKAVAVSPSASLLEIARKNNWQIENWSI